MKKIGFPRKIKITKEIIKSKGARTIKAMKETKKSNKNFKNKEIEFCKFMKKYY